MMDVFEEAKALSCELVVTHHPLIFQNIKQVNSDSYDGRNLFVFDRKRHREPESAHES